MTGVISCEKDLPSCTQNCTTLNINGKVFIAPNGLPLAKIPVEVNWFKKGLCIGCTKTRVIAGSTEADGSFRFTATIDSGYFKDNFLSIRVPADTNFLSPPSSGGTLYYEYRYDQLAAPLLQDINFTFYSKAVLTIRLFRVQTDPFDYFSVDHQFTDNFGYGDYLITGPTFAKDTVLRVQTAADMITRVIWKKTVIGGQSTQKTDSLKCIRAGTNEISVYY
jgi:hypothetical protein